MCEISGWTNCIQFELHTQINILLTRREHNFWFTDLYHVKIFCLVLKILNSCSRMYSHKPLYSRYVPCYLKNVLFCLKKDLFYIVYNSASIPVTKIIKKIIKVDRTCFIYPTEKSQLRSQMRSQVRFHLIAGSYFSCDLSKKI